MGGFIIRINKDGSKVDIEATGFLGETCLDKAAGLILALSGDEESEHKPEYYQTTGDQIRIGG